MAIRQGDEAPKFSLQAGTGEQVDSALLSGQPFVIYFYPKDHTSGCTIETRQFGALLEEFSSAGARVFGCSTGDVAAKADFASSCGAPDLPLLADPDHQVAEAFGAWQMRRGAEGGAMRVARTTYLVGADGVVLRVWEAVDPDGHAAEVLEAVRSLSDRAAS